ncbi:MAG: N-acetylmuramic acid 6-phosphate etherase [Rhizobiaceae bacterium]
MPVSTTESVNSRSVGLDTLAPRNILSILLDGHIAAIGTVEKALAEVEAAAEAMARTVEADGTIAYAAAGSSALMAMADSLELPGTFGIPSDRVRIMIAGGVSSLSDLVGGTEDDAAQAARDVAGIGPGDCIICVSASGRTPYTLAALRAASKAGAMTLAIANNPGAPLLDEAEIAILLSTPPEIVAGSTRLGAATAQKAALNMMSTLMAVRLGHIHDGHMINLRADNDKLRRRARRIVSELGGCDEDTSGRMLEQSGGSVKHAILLAIGVPDMDRAGELLAHNQGNLRRALASLA